MIVVLVMIQVFYCTNTREYTNIRSCRGKLVFDSSRLQERIFVYTLVNCTIKVLLDFSLTVKVAPLIFIFGRGSAILSAKQGK